jgi:hypothetical protein
MATKARNPKISPTTITSLKGKIGISIFHGSALSKNTTAV